MTLARRPGHAGPPPAHLQSLPRTHTFSHPSLRPRATPARLAGNWTACLAWQLSFLPTPSCSANAHPIHAHTGLAGWSGPGCMSRLLRPCTNRFHRPPALRARTRLPHTCARAYTRALQAGPAPAARPGYCVLAPTASTVLPLCERAPTYSMRAPGRTHGPCRLVRPR
eukprot:363419-Chlamydomonas_euryale.AAC.22